MAKRRRVETEEEEQGGIVEGLQLPSVTPVDPKTGESIKTLLWHKYV